MGRVTQLLRGLCERCVPPSPPRQPEGGAPPPPSAATDEEDEAFRTYRTSEAADAAFPPSAVGSAADTEAQHTLRHLGAARPLLGLLQLPLDADRADSELSSFQLERRSLHAATHAFVAAFCTGCHANARLLLPHLPTLIAHCEALPETALPMLLSLFRGDRQLCAAAPAELFAMLIRMHHADGGVSCLREDAGAKGDDVPRADVGSARGNATAVARQRVLLALLQPRGVPLRRSADLVIVELMRTLSERPPPLHAGAHAGSHQVGAAAGASSAAGAPSAAAPPQQLPGSAPSTQAYLSRRRDVAIASGGTSSGAAGGNASRGRWHLHTLQLLAACAHGRSPAALRTCARLYPLPDLLHGAVDTANPTFLRSALVDLLRHAYIATDATPAGVGPSHESTAADEALPPALAPPTPRFRLPCRRWPARYLRWHG